MTRQLTAPVDLIVGGASVPSHANKKRLLAPNRRALAMIDVANRQRIDALAMFELTDADRDRVNTRKRWQVWHTWANTRTKRKTIRTTLGVRRPWVRRGITRSITAKISVKKRKRTIYMPAVGIGRSRFRKREATIIAAHVVRKKDDPEGNLRALRRVAATAAQLIVDKHRVVVIIDANRGVGGPDGTGKIFRAVGLRLAYDDGIDQIWVGPHIEIVSGESITHQVEGRISDHPLTRAHLRLLPITAPKRRTT